MDSARHSPQCLSHQQSLAQGKSFLNVPMVKFHSASLPSSGVIDQLPGSPHDKKKKKKSIWPITQFWNPVNLSCRTDPQQNKHQRGQAVPSSFCSLSSIISCGLACSRHLQGRFPRAPHTLQGVSVRAWQANASKYTREGSACAWEGSPSPRLS